MSDLHVDLAGAFNSAEAAAEQWEAVPGDIKRVVFRWINDWRAVDGGFQVHSAEGIIQQITPSRVSKVGDRGGRKRAQRIIDQLKDSPKLAQAVFLNAAYVWHQAQASGVELGTVPDLASPDEGETVH